MGHFAVNAAMSYQLGAARGIFSILSAMGISRDEFFSPIGCSINSLASNIGATFPCAVFIIHIVRDVSSVVRWMLNFHGVGGVQLGFQPTSPLRLVNESSLFLFSDTRGFAVGLQILFLPVEIFTECATGAVRHACLLGVGERFQSSFHCE
jgi:hypothetical protein